MKRRTLMPPVRKGKPSRAAQSGSKTKRTGTPMGEKPQAPSWINLWGIAGRQEIMEMRRLWQLKIPRR
jgi:hypothetical protein